MPIASPAAIVAAARRTDAIAGAPAAILVAIRLIEAYAIVHALAAIVAAPDDTSCQCDSCQCRRDDHDQRAHRATIH